MVEASPEVEMLTFLDGQYLLRQGEPENPCFVGEMAWLGSFARTASMRCTGRLQALPNNSSCAPRKTCYSLKCLSSKWM
jgi:hypothetical protein